ncbi:class I SAM-dependent methyltransferase [Myxococcus landrumensis]|uniref:Methyltransferase domain-containing protein n=1 Tax=Myxococcus landrumensis TaxID=2813577 RepID=A0ABX7MZ24_9BACT|nr:class I SAM-dependent methyltransferase [Myxococcus landrumus]QSQ11541.1 methyltransferase domain-containing protein [Myxococcus landrumus]
MTVDFGRTSTDYTRHRAGFPDSFFDRLVRENVLRPGLRTVDVGTGTGVVARGLARKGCSVIGLDVSASMLEGARQLATEARLSIDFREAPAESTGLPSASFDLVTAGQCWHWFDRPAAAREAARLLVPGGRLIIAHLDWLPMPGNVVEATDALMNASNPNPPDHARFGCGVGLYPQWLSDVTDAGFTPLETFSYDVLIPYTHEAWRGRCRASAFVGATLPPAEVERFDQTLARILAERFPQPVLDIPHRVFALLATRP